MVLWFLKVKCHVHVQWNPSVLDPELRTPLHIYNPLHARIQSYNFLVSTCFYLKVVTCMVEWLSSGVTMHWFKIPPPFPHSSLIIHDVAKGLLLVLMG